MKNKSKIRNSKLQIKNSKQRSCYSIFIFIFFSFSALNLLAQEEPEFFSDENIPAELTEVLPPEAQENLQPAENIEAKTEKLMPEPIQPIEPGSPSIIKTAGQKISLDIKGMDIVDVLKMLAQRSGLNIVVGKNVTGRVTLFLKDVNVWDAFEIALSANDLAYEKKGGIINVMTQRDYELQYGERQEDKKQVKVIALRYARAADLSRALTQIKTNIGKIVVDEASNTVVLIDTPVKIKELEDFIKETDLAIQTRVFSLQYAQADKLSAKIQEAVTKGVGSVKIDERTNKIVVTDYPEKLSEIAGIIREFDEKTPQVLIDAQIIEIRPSDKFESGVDWDYWIKKNFRLAVSAPVAGVANKLSIGTASGGTVPTEEGEYKGIIDLLRTIGDTKILSSPRIIAINNQEARILVGTKEPYATQTTVTGEGGTVTTAETINFVEVGIKLFVTPTINQDNFVTMKIKPEVSSAAEKYTTSKGERIPIVSTSEAETSVMVKDGITIIIGGLMKEEKSKIIKKVPVLGDIPLLKFFFQSKSDELKKTELVILLTPHIISGASAYTEFSEIKPLDGARFKMERGEIVAEKMSTLEEKEEIASPQEEILDYYAVINKKIKQLSRLNFPQSKKGKVDLVFVISSGGFLVGEPEVINAANESLASFAIKAVKDASPFPEFPVFFKKDQEKFRVSLSYE
ncbi:MAG: secretin N-terminal domain-containing protein [Candidatus Omnitrophota bacterium]|nr:secretin N-terminal domain-containing protein [Candidatus Omnitrophota bacterium]